MFVNAVSTAKLNFITEGGSFLMVYNRANILRVFVWRYEIGRHSFAATYFQAIWFSMIQSVHWPLELLKWISWKPLEYLFKYLNPWKTL